MHPSRSRYLEISFTHVLARSGSNAKTFSWVPLTFKLKEFNPIGIVMTIIIIPTVFLFDRWKIAKVSATVAANAAAEKQ